jgi:antitoxin component YwqK of YwqJK toxin-antitoxin module
MKKTFLLMLVIAAGEFLQAQRLVATYYDWNKIHPSEQYYVNSAGQKSGSYKKYDQSGVVIQEYNYLNGVENGLCVDYEATEGNKRVLVMKASFISGKPEGYTVEYCRYSGYKDKIQEGQYKGGEQTGLWKVWWCDDDTRGVLKEIGSYKNGNQVGEWKAYYRNGFIKTKCTYSSDNKKNGYCAIYIHSDSSKPVCKGNYVRDVRVGEWQVLINGDSKIVSDIENAAGYRVMTFDSAGKQKAGKVTDYDLTGAKYNECYYDDSLRKTGIEIQYYLSNGIIYQKTDHDLGKYEAFYKNGYPQVTGSIVNDIQSNGLWNYYSDKDSGVIVNSGTFSYNLPVGAWKIYFDKDYNYSFSPIGASYYREIVLSNSSTPTSDVVRDFTIKGVKIWEGSMLGQDVYRFSHPY